MNVMRTKKLLLVLMMIISWISVPLMGKKAIKRFLPAGLFITLVVAIEDTIAQGENGGGGTKESIQNYQGLFPFYGDHFLLVPCGY